ncbi:MAG: hypothetical protein KAR40_15420 [Candidatus Sabulitectum sp.]|nr:hypothetical protein [Candidatus Sabulitectum sp.]
MPTPLFPYQEVGASWLSGRVRGGLHDEMGIGKTATTIRALDITGATRCMIIVPAMLRGNWVREFRMFSNRPNLRICQGANIHDFVAWQRSRFDILITSYELATKWAPHMQEHGEFLDAVVMDESHFLKNPDTARARAILGPNSDGVGGVVGWAERSWQLTGTPIPNDPIDIFTFLKFTGCMPLNITEFRRRYFTSRPTAYGFKQSCRPEMISELQALVGNNSLRRTKRDVGMQLPPIFLTALSVDGDTSSVRHMMAEHPNLEEAIVEALEHGGLSFIDAQHVATLRRLIGEAKAIPYARMLLSDLRSGQTDKRVVFGIHRAALGYVHKFLLRNKIDAVLVNGDVSDRLRGEAVDRFQSEDKCRVFLGNIQAAGTGLTLTAAHEIDLLESSWTPAGNAQALMRVHRIGQAHNVYARLITLSGSFDEVVNKIVARKVRDIAEIEGADMLDMDAVVDL